MPAPSIFDILDFESLIEAAAKTVLEAQLAAITPALPAIQVTTSRDSDTLAAPHYTLTFATGEGIDQWGAIGQANPKQVNVAYYGMLTVELATTRPDDDAMMSPIHGLMRAIARYTFSAQAKAFTESNLPYLQILEIKPAGTRAQLQENKAQDIDQLLFAFKFAIRNDAWPATP